MAASVLATDIQDKQLMNEDCLFIIKQLNECVVGGEAEAVRSGFPESLKPRPCQMINPLPGLPALRLPPPGDLSYHLALAFLPSPNIYPLIDFRQSSSVTFKSPDSLSRTQSGLDTHERLSRAADGSFYLTAALLFFYVQRRKEKSQYLATGSC